MGKFKLKGFPMHQGVSVSPTKKVDFKHSWNKPETSDGSLIPNTTNSLIQDKKDEIAEVKETAGDMGLETTSDKYNPDGTLKEDNKKWHEKDTFKESGIGSIVEAVKSIRRGIKNVKAKKKAKKAEKISDAKLAIESDTQTLKQQTLIDRINKRQRKKDIKDIRKSEKDRIKLVKYNKRKKKKA